MTNWTFFEIRHLYPISKHSLNAHKLDVRQKRGNIIAQTTTVLFSNKQLIGVDYLNIMSFALETKWYIMYQASDVVFGHISK